jgi:isohexenylglutaconyl-CoA hydratase
MTANPNAILLENESGVLTIHFNRPEVRNAMSLEMVSELRTALAQAESDGSTRVIVLRGTGGHFCAGADLKDMAAARARFHDGDSDAIAEVNAQFGKLCSAFASSPLVVISVLQGTVMGGGFGLACAADLSLADDSTVFRLPETSLGIVPAQIAPFLVERLGYSEAKRLAVTGARLSAREALAIRLVHEAHSNADELDAAVARNLKQILECAPGAIAATKTLIAKARFAYPHGLIDEAAAVFSQTALSAEGIEGTLAFLQKRKPHWASA